MISSAPGTGTGPRVGARRCDGFEDIADGNDAGFQGKFAGHRSVWIAFTVESFVVGAAYHGQFPERRDTPQDFLCVCRMAANLLPFFRRQRAFLVELYKHLLTTFTCLWPIFVGGVCPCVLLAV